MHPPTSAIYTTLALLTLATYTSAACSSYVLVNTRGTGELQGESIGFRSMIDSVLAAVPNGSIYNTVYPAAPDATQQTTLIGSADIAKKIQTGLTECPQQLYALLGYSQGATVTNQVLQRFSPTSVEGQAIKAVVQIGNPYHLPDKQGNVDDKCGGSTAGANGALLPTANYTIPDSWYGTGKVRDLCYAMDGVCMGYDATNVLSGAHFFYGFSPSVQECGAGFLIGKLG